MLTLPTWAGTISGRLDGLIASRNRGGQYLKAFTQPTDPGSAAQLVLRTAIATAHTAWSGLTDAQRAAWYEYSLEHPRENRIGQAHPIGGYQEFIRRYVMREQIRASYFGTLTVGTTPPGPFSDFSTPAVVTINAAGTRLSIAWPSDPWRLQAGSVFGVYASGPLSGTTMSHKNPWQIIGAVRGDATTPPTSPSSINIPVAMQPASGQKVAWRIRMSAEDADLGLPTIGLVQRP